MRSHRILSSGLGAAALVAAVAMVPSPAGAAAATLYVATTGRPGMNASPSPPTTSTIG